MGKSNQIEFDKCKCCVQKSGEIVSEDQLHEILGEVDVNKNAQVDLGEFLQVVLFCHQFSYCGFHFLLCVKYTARIYAVLYNCWTPEYLTT